MKINFSFIKKNFQKEKSELKVKISWQIIVVLFFIMIGLSFFFSYKIYMQVDQEYSHFTENDSKKTEKEKKEKINKVLEYFSEREEKSTEIKNSPAPFVDPSI